SAEAVFKLEPYLDSYSLMVNMRPFPNVHFRRALALTIDRQALDSVLRGWGMPSDHFVPATAISKMTPEEQARCGPDKSGDGLLVSADLCYHPGQGIPYDPETARRAFQKA